MASFLDTNILLYSFSTDRAEQKKSDIARALLKSRQHDWTLSVQVLQEFYVQATRPTRRFPLSHEDALDILRVLLRFRVQDNTLRVFHGALKIKSTYGLSYWDSAILSAALAAGCGQLFSEDLSHGMVVEGVMIVNPFF